MTNFPRTHLKGLFLYCTLLFAARALNAQCTISSSSASNFWTPDYFAQSFKATCNGYITSIAVTNWAGATTFSIRNGAGYNGTVAYTASNATTTGGASGIYTLSTPLQVTSGNYYTFRIDGYTGYNNAEPRVNNNTYADGQIWYSTTGAGTWTSYTINDIYFSVTVTAVQNWYLDADNDGHYVSGPVSSGSSPGAGYNTTATSSGDCNDNDNTKWQSATLYTDADGDGYDNGSQTVCYGAAIPAGYSAATNGTDCNDNAYSTINNCNPVGSPPCNGWFFTRNITINPATPSANFQVKVALASGQYGNMQSTGADLRFRDGNGNNCSYFIESWNTSGASVIWVKVPVSGTTGITMYYGNNSAPPASNADSTFIVYDDFSGTGLNGARWDAKTGGTSSVTVSGGELILNSGTTDGEGCQIISKTGFAYSDGTIVETTLGTGGTAAAVVCGTRASFCGATALHGTGTFFDLDISAGSYACWSAGRNGQVTVAGINSNGSSISYTASQGNSAAGDLMAVTIENGVDQYFKNGSLIQSLNTATPATTLYAVLNYFRGACQPGTNQQLKISLIRVRKYKSSYSPTVTVGSQAAAACAYTWVGGNSTAWATAANWDANLVPSAGTNVIIAGATNSPVITTAVTVSDVTVASGGHLTVNNGGSFTQNGALSNSGTITIKTGAAFLQGNASTYSGNGTFTVENSISNTADGYRDLSSPVNTTVADLAADFPVFGDNGVHCYYLYNPYPNVQVYDEALGLNNGAYDEGWVSYTGTTNPLSPMKGIAARTYQGAPYTITLSGAPYNGAQTIAVTKTNTATTSQDGWNFVGNPYASPVDWVSVAALNPGITGSYYVFHTTGEFTGNWGTCNAAGTCAGNPLPGRYISPMQGFFVKANSNGNFIMNNSVRVTNSSTFYKTDAALNEIRLDLGNGTNSDEIVTYTDAAATDGNDGGLDAEKIPAGSTVYISFKMQGTEYAINVINNITEQTELPLVIWAKTDGNYTLNAHTLNVTGYTVYLKDNQTNSLIDLSAQSPVLALTGRQAYNHYSLVFTAQAATGILPVNTNAKIYSAGSSVFVNRSGNGKATITICNLLGQQLFEKTTEEKNAGIPLNTTGPEYVIVKVMEGEKVSVAKVLVAKNQ